MKQVIKELYTKKKFRVINYLNSITARWNNTRINFFPDHKFEDGKESNLLEFVRLQDEDLPPLCVGKKVRVINGRAHTIGAVRLSDEAIIALHEILCKHIRNKMQKENHRDWTDEALQVHIDQWSKGQDDVWLSEQLNALNLPWEQYQMAVDYYKKIGPYRN